MLISSLGLTVEMEMDPGLHDSQKGQLKIEKKAESHEMVWSMTLYLSLMNASQELRRLGQLYTVLAVIDPRLGMTQIV